MKTTYYCFLLSFFFILSCSESSNFEFKDVSTPYTVETKGIIWSDSVPPVIDPDRELGGNSCEQDRDWKLQDLVEDYRQYFTNPGSVNKHNVGGAGLKPGTPEWVQVRFRDTYYAILRDYDYCREHH